ncbi:MAG: flhB [Burkholderiaceae bacterium]|nr:flhB [Burkholderiaceae bacterium]
MAEESDLEKTESPSPRRLEKAREEGNVPRSRELATCTILLAGGAGMWVMGDGLMLKIRHMLSSSLAFERSAAFDMPLLLTRIIAQVGDLALAFAPLAILLLVVALATPMLIGGWLFSTNALMPDFGKLNPMSGLANMFSIRALVELLKAIGKSALISVIAWMVVSNKLNTMLMLGMEPLKAGVAHMGDLMLACFMWIVGGLVLIACIDVPYQLWQYTQKLKMTREEVRQEAKESEGNPEIKAKIRAQQREMARRRMMTQVPTADVVVTNPTHYAVAIKYVDGKMRAPQVVAKGMGEVAARIRELATENNVPLMEAPPLARALYKHTDLGDEIPQTLYIAVAEVLAYVFQLRAFRQNGGRQPEMPTNIEVPPEMDPNNQAQQTETESRSIQ